MSAEILRNGSIVIVGDDYSSATVDFGRKASLTKTLIGAGRWWETGPSPVDSLSGFIDEIAEARGAARLHL